MKTKIYADVTATKPSELLTPETWCKGTLRKGNAKIGYQWCLLGSIWEISSRAEIGLLTGMLWRNRLKDAVLMLYPSRVQGESPAAIVENFNDHKDTTFEDVRHVMILANV